MIKFAGLLFLGFSLGLSQNAASQFVNDSSSVQTVAAVKQMTGEVEKDFLSSMAVEIKRIEIVGNNLLGQSSSSPPAQ